MMMVRKSKGLGERHQRILDFLLSYQRENRYPPSIREIGEKTGITSTSVVNYYLDQLEKMGSGNAQIELRMTGCPNSCVRTPSAEIGLSGRSPGKYAMHVGGSPQGTRLAYLFRETVTSEELPSLLHKLIQGWRKGARSGESFGDWAWRLERAGVDAILSNGK